MKNLLSLIIVRIHFLDFRTPSSPFFIFPPHLLAVHVEDDELRGMGDEVDSLRIRCRTTRPQRRGTELDALKERSPDEVINQQSLIDR